MTNKGRVLRIWSLNEMASNKPCLGIETDATAVFMSPYNRPCNAVCVELGQPMPTVGDVIEWGPHHVWWGGEKIDKIGNSFNCDDPLR